jgi:outer membrane protein assembly factor BamB
MNASELGSYPAEPRGRMTIMNRTTTRHRFKRWLAVPLAALAAGFVSSPAQAQGIISPPTMLEVTVSTARPGPIYGGVALAPSTGNFYVSALASNSAPAQIIACKSNNTLLWTNVLQNVGTNADGSYVVPTLSADGASLFVGTEQGVVYCLNATNSSAALRWSNNIGYKVRSQLALSGDGSALYVRTADSVSINNSKLIALNATNGVAVWTNSIGDKLPTTSKYHLFSFASAPVVAGNSNIYLGTATGHVLGFNPAGSNVFDLNLATATIANPPTDLTGLTNLTQIYHSTNSDTPLVQIEAPLALGTNGWLYVGTRNIAPTNTDNFMAVLLAIDPSQSTNSALRWVVHVGNDDGGYDKGILASPILDRAGFVYATDWGHHIEQFDAQVGNPTGAFQGSGYASSYYRIWTYETLGTFLPSQITGKLYGTPALTEDGLLVVATSGVTNYDSDFNGSASLVALRTEGDYYGYDQLPLWATTNRVGGTSPYQLDMPVGDGTYYHPSFYGSPAISSAGYIYIADDLGRVLRFAGSTPLMEGPWPSLAGGNSRMGHPLSYAWNVREYVDNAN